MVKRLEKVMIARRNWQQLMIGTSVSEVKNEKHRISPGVAFLGQMIFRSISLKGQKFPRNSKK